MALRHKKAAAVEDSMNESVKHMTDEELFKFAGFDKGAAERAGYSNYSYWRSTFQVFFKNRLAVFLLFLIGVILLFTFLQPVLPGQRSATQIFNDASGMQLRNLQPSSEFWFGTNSIGQDLWSRFGAARALRC